MNIPVVLILLLFAIPIYFNMKGECKPNYYWEHEEDKVIIHYTKCGKLDDEFKEKVLNYLQPYIEEKYGNEIEIKFRGFDED